MVKYLEFLLGRHSKFGQGKLRKMTRIFELCNSILKDVKSYCQFSTEDLQQHLACRIIHIASQSPQYTDKPLLGVSEATLLFGNQDSSSAIRTLRPCMILREHLASSSVTSGYTGKVNVCDPLGNMVTMHPCLHLEQRKRVLYTQVPLPARLAACCSHSAQGV